MSNGQPRHVLITAAQIQARIRELVVEIRRNYQEADELHLVGVLKGACIFLSDLARAMPGPVSLDFVALSSYAAGDTTSGEVRLLKEPDSSLTDRHVIVVEDIADTGTTLAYLHGVFHDRRPRSLRTVCLLNKPARRRVAVSIDHVGFEIEDRFVVGYGLDHGERYRNLVDILALD